MRIVQLANLVHRTSGGLRVVIEQLGAGYDAAGHERVVVLPGARATRRRSSKGTLWITEPGVPLPRSGGYRLLTDRARLGRLLDELRPDAVEVSDRWTLPWITDWAAAQGLTGTVIVHERLEHVLDTWLPGGVGASRLAAHADRRLARRAGAIVVPSRFAAAGFPEPRTRVVPWGVDLEVFHPERRRPRAPGAEIRLVTVGRLSAEKRPELAIDVLVALLERGLDVELAIIGDGPLRRRVRRHASGLPVHLHGHLPAEAVAEQLAAADVALSTCPAESFGLAALEALACGTPVVVPISGALPEVLGCQPGSPTITEAGALASPTPLAMAFAVQRLLGIDPSQRRAAARARAQRYPWSQAVDAMLALHSGSVAQLAVP